MGYRLFLIANHKDRYCGETLVKRGQFYRSNKYLANRWNWSESKVKKFKAKLKRMDLIHYKPRGKNVVPITLVEYDKTQGDLNDDGAQPDGKADEDDTTGERKEDCIQ